MSLDFLGPTILRSDFSELPTIEILDKVKLTLVYFNAKWNHGSAQYLTDLDSFIESCKKDNVWQDIEIIFGSADRTLKDFRDHFSQMTNFLAMPFDQDKINQFAAAIGLETLPALAIFDQHGKLVKNSAQNDIRLGPSIVEIWTNPLFSSLLGDQFVSAENENFSYHHLTNNNEVICLYFAADWAPFCKGFTPKLTDWYTLTKQAGKSFEVIWVSLDKDETSFEENLKQVPWLRIPFNSSHRKLLIDWYGITKLPS
jgi:nucleoredoxin